PGCLIVNRNRNLARTDGASALRGSLEPRACRTLTSHTNHTNKSKQSAATKPLPAAQLPSLNITQPGHSEA
ncbi:MAG: hypothetical protein ACO3GW_08540, partial [Vulcanococcus sp.]